MIKKWILLAKDIELTLFLIMIYYTSMGNINFSVIWLINIIFMRFFFLLLNLLMF
jgi:hypothetical protein